ncbi:MAG: ferrous iron transport protein A [Spirulinaceae cyanobacterium]
MKQKFSRLQKTIFGGGQGCGCQQSDRAPTDQSEMRLHHLAVGTSGRITGYSSGHSGFRHKLLSMGLTPGTEVKIVRVAPLGDPIEIFTRGFYLSLRQTEAELLTIQPLNCHDT